MPVAVGDIVRVAAKMVYDGADEFINVYTVEHSGVSAVANSVFLTGMATELGSLYANIAQYVTSDLVPTSFTAYNVTQDAPIGEAAWSVAGGFIESAEPLPTQAAMLVSLATGVKKVIGKKFIPGLTIDDVTGGNVLVAAVQTALANFGAHLLTSFIVGGEDFNHGVQRSVGGAFRGFASAIARSGVFTQRRRRPGEGA